MANTDQSVLAQKVKSSTVSTDGFPELTNLGSAVAKAVGECGSATLGASGLGGVGSLHINQIRSALSNAPEFSAYTWLSCGMDCDGALIYLDPVFVSVLTQRMLGGPLAAVDGDVSLTPLNIQIANKFVDALIAPLNQELQKKTGPVDDLILRRTRNANNPELALGEIETMSIIEIRVDLTMDDLSMKGALTMCFPVSYAERAGFMTKRATGKTVAKDPFWSQKLNDNVRQAPIDIDVVLDQFEKSVGDLSRMEVGQILSVEPGAAQALRLYATTCDGPSIVALGRLGAYKTLKAVKLTTDVDPNFSGEL
ncbi:MAG: FliM/FliN family flagellar motor switch protein [Pseudomonadota bacterium]